VDVVPLLPQAAAVIARAVAAATAAGSRDLIVFPSCTAISWRAKEMQAAAHSRAPSAR